MKDSFNRTIDYCRISVTDLCNFRCKYCMPDGVFKKKHDDILSLEELKLISDTLAMLGVHKQRITGGEPLIRKNVLSLIRNIGKNKLVDKLAITTNGSLLNIYAEELKQAGVTNLNISLDTLNPEVFGKISSSGDLADTLKGIEKAKALKFDTLKLNCVLLKGINDCEINKLADFGKENGIPVRFIELMPFTNQQNYSNKYYTATSEIIAKYDLTAVPVNDVTDKVRYYRFPNGGIIGFISPVSDKFCRYCNRIRITADGKLLNCLHENKEYDLKPYLSNQVLLADKIMEFVRQKPPCHSLREGKLQNREMDEIGG